MFKSRTLRVGTRESKLARLQTDLVLELISSRFPQLQFELVAIKTSGDKVLNKPLAELGGQGVFVKELEESLLAQKTDFVVHSLKDLPCQMPAGLLLVCSLERSDPRDILISRTGLSLEDLPAGSRVATSSRRRTAQLRRLRDDLCFVDMRGNIQTRLRKLDEGQCEAMVLAAAGILRLGLSERISQYFEVDKSTPAVGQGALALQCRKDDTELVEFLSEFNDLNVWQCITAERALLAELGGGCSVPVGAFAEITGNDEIELRACVCSLDGKEIYIEKARSERSQAEELGLTVAKKLIEKGAGLVIKALIEAPASVSPP